MSLTLKINYPETLPDVLNETRKEFEQEAKMAMAAKLFEMGRISSGIEAKMAGISRVSFILELRKFNVNAINYPSEELESDLNNAWTKK